MIVHKSNACSIHDAMKATDEIWAELSLQSWPSLSLSLCLQWSGQWPGAVDEQ